jgi:hypothetical protein
MTSLEQRVKGFLETWAKRKTGELPPIDLSVNCSSCGSKIMGDGKVEFTANGLVCENCFSEAELGMSSLKEIK